MRPPRSRDIVRQRLLQARVTPDRCAHAAPEQPAVALACQLGLRDKTGGGRCRRAEIHGETAGIEAQDRFAQVAQHDHPMAVSYRQMKRAVGLGHRQRERAARRWTGIGHADANVDRQRPDPDVGARRSRSGQSDQRCAGNQPADAHRRHDAYSPWGSHVAQALRLSHRRPRRHRRSSGEHLQRVSGKRSADQLRPVDHAVSMIADTSRHPQATSESQRGDHPQRVARVSRWRCRRSARRSSRRGG